LKLSNEFNEIKTKLDEIKLPKVSVTTSPYSTSSQPMIPITGQSRLNIFSTKSLYDDQGVFRNRMPEDWEITWETGALETLIVEYYLSENMNPDYEGTMLYAEVYDVQSNLQPIIGSGCMDVDENYQDFGSYLGSVDSTKHLSYEKKDFHAQLSVPGEGRNIHITPLTVTGESVESDTTNVYYSKRYKKDTDLAWFEACSINVDLETKLLRIEIARKQKSTYGLQPELWTSWKKLELRSGGTVACMMASIQADGSYELFEKDLNDPKVKKCKYILQKLYVDQL
jgi:hypothetical protein